MCRTIIRKPRTSDGKKTYLSPWDPAKLRINRIYAKVVKRCLGINARHVILDTEYCVTSRTLVEHGFSKTQITAPNINKHDCLKLMEFGIRAPLMTIEECLNDGRRKPNALWYDSMTTIGGSVKNQHYPGVVADRFFLQNRSEIGKSCVFALTLTSHNNQTRSIHESNESTMIKQISRLAMSRGFVIEGCQWTWYKKNMIYGMWHLIYDPVAVLGKHKKLLMWKGTTNHVIGFPPGYDI